jgi:hypothetical protein
MVSVLAPLLDACRKRKSEDRNFDGTIYRDKMALALTAIANRSVQIFGRHWEWAKI